MKNKLGIHILVPQHIALNILRNKSCLHKQNRHFSIASAEEQIAQMERRGFAPVGSLNVYPCQFCGAYHVGHQKKSA